MRPVSLALSVLQNRLGRVPRPSWCTYLVCYRCNARCQMCDSWRLKPGDELTPAEVATVFGKIGRLDVVRLTGGEPFLREDMLEIAEAVRERSQPFVIHVTTNGSFPERVVEMVEGFSRPQMLRFMVSFDGLEAEHDRNRGEEVTFAGATETVRRLVGLRERFGVEVSANHTVISPQSLADNQELRRRMGEWNVDVHSVLAYADSAMYGAKLRGRKAEHLIVPTGYPLHPLLAGADVLGFVEQELARVNGFGSPMLRWGKRYYLRGLRARLRGESPARPNPRCVALRSHIRILPDGGVPVCQFNTERVGNLLHQSFEDVWHNGAATASRAWVDKCPGCWAECEVMPNAIYSGDIVRG
ncbi:MAG: radical SAM protein [Phycisphaerae bacterium]|nr:radical SAM protein [Phycisphaerae bacterium]MCZ2400289.1 radical SAM protein [Phycisphaerae bacterium]